MNNAPGNGMRYNGDKNRQEPDVLERFGWIFMYHYSKRNPHGFEHELLKMLPQMLF